MNARDVLLAVPTRGQVGWATATRLGEIRDRSPGLAPIAYVPGNLSVALTRNTIVRRFLDGPWKVLAMVDDDVVPPPRFLDMADRLTGYGMLGIPYPLVLKDVQVGLAVFNRVEGGLRYARITSGVHRCDAIGTGCVMIPRETLEQLGADPFRMAHDPTAEITSDDFLFCDLLAEAGISVGYWMPSDGYADHQRLCSLGRWYEAQAEMIGRVA